LQQVEQTDLVVFGFAGVVGVVGHAGYACSCRG
jgi:hypothetical protein